MILKIIGGNLVDEYKAVSIGERVCSHHYYRSGPNSMEPVPLQVCDNMVIPYTYGVYWERVDRALTYPVCGDLPSAHGGL